jgi:tellurite methyltransferase
MTAESSTVEYWNQYYIKSTAPNEASSWAEFSLKFLQHHDGVRNLSTNASNDEQQPPRRRILMDLGCGNGRDTRYFARDAHGLFCIGIDAADAVIAKNRADTSVASLAYYAADFTRHADLDSALAKHVDALTSESTHPKADFIYSRFTLHAISKVAASRVYAWAAEHLADNGFFFIEARSVLSSLYGVGDPDPAGDPDAWCHGHYRRFLRRNELVEELQSLGLEIVLCEERSGLSPVVDDDPVLIRVICKPKPRETSNGTLKHE